MSQPAAEHAAAYALKHGLQVYLKDSAQLFAALKFLSSDSNDAKGFLGHYLTAVVCGQHLPWRHYAFVAGDFSSNQLMLCLNPVTTVVWWISTVLSANSLSFVDDYCCRHSLQQTVLLGDSTAQPSSVCSSRAPQLW
jgi:hypothetical protein